MVLHLLYVPNCLFLYFLKEINVSFVNESVTTCDFLLFIRVTFVIMVNKINLSMLKTVLKDVGAKSTGTKAELQHR